MVTKVFLGNKSVQEYYEKLVKKLTPLSADTEKGHFIEGFFAGAHQESMQQAGKESISQLQELDPSNANNNRNAKESSPIASKDPREVEVEETTPEAAVSPRNTLQNSSPKAETKKKESTWVCTVLAKVNKHAVPILVDTGLAISVISEDTVDRLAQDIQVDNSPNKIIGRRRQSGHSGSGNVKPLSILAGQAIGSLCSRQDRTNAGATFQRAMNSIFQGNQWIHVLTYINDIIIFSKSFSEHMEHLEEGFKCLYKAGVRLKPSKCMFCTKEIHFLGHVISREGIRPDPDKIRAIVDMPAPKSKEELRRFLGLTGYNRQYIKNYANKVQWRKTP
ncbi:Transposon Ty3-I Gag-Pol polyprotein [Pelomyxa schiedti]|nr:Transposon Ty3-I Gag-Pol polyprotein [Pelomyxa schiedti]